jgi:hypothetical protein
MKWIFLLLNVMTDREAVMAAVRCAFDSGVTSVGLLLLFGLRQMIRYKAQRRHASTV